MTKELVVSYYKENLTWLNKVKDCKITVYNKSSVDIPNTIRLENVGREMHTYFHHIVTNYDNLSDWVFFTQGEPFDHVKNYDWILDVFPNSLTYSKLRIDDCHFFTNGIFKNMLVSLSDGRPHHNPVLNINSLLTYPFTKVSCFLYKISSVSPSYLHTIGIPSNLPILLHLLEREAQTALLLIPIVSSICFILENSNFYDERQDYLYTSPRKNTSQGTLPSLNLTKTTNKYTPPASDVDIDNAIVSAELGNEDALGNLSRTYLEQQNQKLPTEKTVIGSIRGKKLSEVSGSYTGPQGDFTEAATTYYTEGNYTEEQRGRVTKNGNVLKENRILLGDQGARRDQNKSTNIYWTTSATKAEIDTLNALEPVTAKVNGEEEGRDIVKFRFHVITPTETKVLYFRAFLDNFADNYTGQWNPTKYLGRGEDFQVYGGFQRKITLSFKIAAATRSEMKPLYQKMIYLASSTAPTYADNGQFMRGTIVKMTVGDYVYELPGVMNSVNYSWNVDYPWEIAMLEPEGVGDSTMQELPMIMDCSIDFTPIHTFTPETGLKKYFTAGTNGTNSFI